MEHLRRQSGDGTWYQFVDSEYWLVVDLGSSTPKIERGYPTKEEALEATKGWDWRYAVVRLECIRGFAVPTPPTEPR